MKPRDYIELLEHPDATANLTHVHDARADLLLGVLVHTFVADSKVHEGEIALLKRLIGPHEDAQAYIEKLGARSLDLDAIAAAFPDPQDRDDIITLAEHAVWGDDEVDPREWDIVDALVDKLGVVRP